MKWSVAVLVVVGILAAISAAILVAYWSGGHPVAATPQPQPKPVVAEEQVDVLYATKALPSLTIVDQQSVLRKKVPKGQAPMVFMSDAALVVGRALRVGMGDGQVFTPECLADKDSGIHVAAAVPPGMRAASVSLSNYEALHGLLYPGSVVDILFMFRGSKTGGPSGNEVEETVSMSLMKGVQVLAVGDRTIIASPPEVPGNTQASGQKETVTLLVTPKQAELLQLAQENGSISLTMRSPLDTASTPDSETMLSQLTQFFRKARPVAASPRIPTTEPVAVKTPVNVDPPDPPKPPQWKVTTIRGEHVAEESFPIPEVTQHQ